MCLNWFHQQPTKPNTHPLTENALHYFTQKYFLRLIIHLLLLIKEWKKNSESEKKYSSPSLPRTKNRLVQTQFFDILGYIKPFCVTDKIFPGYRCDEEVTYLYTACSI